jgi:hypothetical protein
MPPIKPSAHFTLHKWQNQPMQLIAQRKMQTKQVLFEKLNVMMHYIK